MKTIRKELNKLIKELLEEGTITHTQEYPDEPYPGQHSFDASADEEYEEIEGYEEDDSQYGKVDRWIKSEGIIKEWKQNFPGFSSKEYDVIQNWIDMGSLSQTIAMYKKNKKSFTAFIKDAARG